MMCPVALERFDTRSMRRTGDRLIESSATWVSTAQRASGDRQRPRGARPRRHEAQAAADGAVEPAAARRTRLFGALSQTRSPGHGPGRPQLVV